MVRSNICTIRAFSTSPSSNGDLPPEFFPSDGASITASCPNHMVLLFIKPNSYDILTIIQKANRLVSFLPYTERWTPIFKMQLDKLSRSHDKANSLTLVILKCRSYSKCFEANRTVRHLSYFESPSHLIGRNTLCYWMTVNKPFD